MSPVAPHFWEVGTGPAVVCIHAGYGSSWQWRPLAHDLAGEFRVLACDMSDSGKSPAMPTVNEYTLDEEVDFLAPVFDAAGSAFHLIGHSFGAAVAMKTAMRFPGRVRSLTLFEPTLFALLVSSAPDSSATREILEHVEITSGLADRGEYEAAGECFVDYWVGEGAWAEMPAEVRTGMCARMSLTRQRWNALLRDPVSLQDIASMDVCTLLMTSEMSNTPTQALGQLLTEALRGVSRVALDGLGHMAPLSHPDRVNPLINNFLAKVVSP